MRSHPSVLHLDLDAFFAAVEQRDKPSLRGKPVVVGGVGLRGVVSTASYEARRYGIRSAMPTWDARRRATGATAFLSGRFDAYRASSRVVMGLLREVSPVMQAVSVDEAYLDLAAVRGLEPTVGAVRAVAEGLRAQITELTGGLTASVGIASSRMMAKIASELAKPDGVHVVAPGDELATLHPLAVRAVGGIGPVTTERLAQLGVHTVGELAALGQEDLIATFGQSHGKDLYAMARAQDDRPVVIEAANRSISVEETYPVDLHGAEAVERALEGLARRAADRLARASFFGRTVTIKVRDSDFATRNRSATLPQPTGDAEVVVAEAIRLARLLGVVQGVRLLGVGVSGLTEWAQEMLFTALPGEESPAAGVVPVTEAVRDPLDLYGPMTAAAWRPGQDVRHDELGPGWVWGSGRGRVTVRFEGPRTGIGPVRSFASDDPALHPAAWPRWWAEDDPRGARIMELAGAGVDEE